MSSITERLNQLNVDYQVKSDELVKETLFLQKYTDIPQTKEINNEGRNDNEER